MERRKTTASGTTNTRYAFDPLDWTASKTTDVGTAAEETTIFNYRGLTGDLLDEEVDGRATKSYLYSPSGERLAQITHNADESEEAFYGYNPHPDVETLTEEDGDTRATYGYTAYGSNDDAQFTGIDKPDMQDPTRGRTTPSGSTPSAGTAAPVQTTRGSATTAPDSTAS